MKNWRTPAVAISIIMNSKLGAGLVVLLFIDGEGCFIGPG